MSRSLESCHRSEAYRHPNDPDAGRSAGTATTMGVPALERVDEAALPRVHEARGRRGVETLHAHGCGTSAPPSAVVEFPYAGSWVTARPDEIPFPPRPG